MFVDELTEHLATGTRGERELAVEIAGSTIVSANNVSKFLYEGTDKEEWKFSDFPCVTPPFDTMFVQWNTPDKIVSDKFGIITGHRIIKTYGILIRALKIDGRLPEAIRDNDRLNKFREYEAKGKWLNAGTVYQHVYDGRIQYLFSIMWMNDQNGAIFDLDNGKTSILFMVPNDEMQMMIEHFGSEKDLAHSLEAVMYVPFLTLSFMHCKNTILQTQTHSEKLQKARRSNGKKILLTYKVLDIGPVRSILKSAGKMGEVGLKRSLHFCRGHFKDFREETGSAGLYGKYHGLFWWDMHKRGNAEKGIIVKDYNVNPNSEP